MNAEEARNKAFEFAQPQIKEIEKKILDAANKGHTQIQIEGDLLLGTKKWLKENGYKVSTEDRDWYEATVSEDPPTTYIDWD